MSTQQLKGVVVDANLMTVSSSKVEFDVDIPSYKTIKGVYAKGKEIVAPVAMWLEALDLLMQRLSETPGILERLAAVSGACQQHGSVFFNSNAEQALKNMGHAESLRSALEDSFAWEMSPNWQDHSTGMECSKFEDAVGGKQKLADITGSRAHYRFTGPQILKLKTQQPEKYAQTKRISLVSSFLTSILAGKISDIEISDACGMNLWNVEGRHWEPRLIQVIGAEVENKLGSVETKGGEFAGLISSYFTKKYGVSHECQVNFCTGDNPGTILALPLQMNDVMVSLGTSTTALIVTENYRPSPLYHLFSHPTGRGYMGMLCYCNGALAREKVRDSLLTIGSSSVSGDSAWDDFNEIAISGAPLGADDKVKARLGVYFPLGEIIPDVGSQTRRFVVWPDDSLEEVKSGDDVGDPDSSNLWGKEQDVVCILESQALSIRERLEPMLTTADKCPSRIFFVGGGSKNRAICQVMSRVLSPANGAYRLELSDACAMGAAHKAAWADVADTISWEAFIDSKWNMANVQAVPQLAAACDYGEIVPIFEQMESRLV